MTTERGPLISVNMGKQGNLSWKVGVHPWMRFPGSCCYITAHSIVNGKWYVLIYDLEMVNLPRSQVFRFL